MWKIKSSTFEISPLNKKASWKKEYIEWFKCGSNHIEQWTTEKLCSEIAFFCQTNDALWI